jgi:hypothetical protein
VKIRRSPSPIQHRTLGRACGNIMKRCALFSAPGGKAITASLQSLPWLGIRCCRPSTCAASRQGSGPETTRGRSFSWIALTKTGRAAAGTLSRWSSAILDAYLAKISIVPVGDAPLFRNRSGAPYSKDTLGDDFRAVRTMVFGKDDDRQLADIRRSGAVEATAGGAKVEKLAKKMANTISASTRLQKVYNPVDVESVRSVDQSREQARRERKANEKCHKRRSGSVTKTDPKR